MKMPRCNAPLRRRSLLVASCGLSLLPLGLLFQLAVAIFEQRSRLDLGHLLVSAVVLSISVPIGLSVWLFVLRPSARSAVALKGLCVTLALLMGACAYVSAIAGIPVGIFVCLAVGAFGTWAAWVYSGAASALRRIEPRNLCPICGYDLRATADPNGRLLDRCPECGLPIVSVSEYRASSSARDIATTEATSKVGPHELRPKP